MMQIGQTAATSGTTTLGQDCGCQDCGCDVSPNVTNGGFESLLQEVLVLLQELLARLAPSGPAGNLGMASTPELADDRAMAGMEQFVQGLSANLNRAATSMGSTGDSADPATPATFNLLTARLPDGADAVRLSLGGNS